MAHKTVADVVVETLQAVGVKHCWGVPGDTLNYVTDAIRRANATEFGLAAAVFTADDLRARRVGRELRVSTVWLNTFGMHTQQMAGTPVKQSGYGSLAGSAAVEAFQNTKRYGTAMPPA